MVMELCQGVSLFQLVEFNTLLAEDVARTISKQVQTPTVPISRAYLYSLQVFSAVSYLHSLGIVHGDIKASFIESL